MMDTYNLSEHPSTGSFRRARQIVGGVTLLLAITLAGPPRLLGDCAYITNINVSVSPTTVLEGQETTVTLTFTLNVPVSPCNTYGADMFEIIWGARAPNGRLLGEGDRWIWLGGTSAQYQFQTSGYGFTQPTRVAFIAAPYAPAYLEDVPSGQLENAANLGKCKQCQQQASVPVNVTTGNVWIPQRDYSVPGLGGGLELSRVWNSRWMYAAPPALVGMFGLGWRSTYEEQLLAAGDQTLQYWRGDGSGWTFTYNSVLNAYSLSSPPDERAQLVANPATGGFTLTLADGTQKVFNSQDLLAAVIDRNHNQTTLAYDSSNRLTSVTSPGGSTLTFTYGDANNPMQVTTVQDSVGVVATYTYDSSSRLTKVSYPDGSALNFAYDANSSMILSVTDSQGKLLESHTYDAQDRGLTSARAYGVDSVSLSY
jgi:YD repeat-containing protein